MKALYNHHLILSLALSLAIYFCNACGVLVTSLAILENSSG